MEHSVPVEAIASTEIIKGTPKLNAALAEAQKTIFNPGKNRTVDVQSKTGGRSYSYEYAELNVVTEIIRKPCADAGLSFTQSLEHRNERWIVVTELLHSSGEERQYLFPLFTTPNDKMKNEQVFAAGFTYAKRQALKGVFGIADDTEDKDAQDGVDGAKITPKTTAKVKPPIKNSAPGGGSRGNINPASQEPPPFEDVPQDFPPDEGPPPLEEDFPGAFNAPPEPPPTKLIPRAEAGKKLLAAFGDKFILEAEQREIFQRVVSKNRMVDLTTTEMIQVREYVEKLTSNQDPKKVK